MSAALDALQGETPRMVTIREDLARLLGHPSMAGRLPPILILGETGTGKGLLARAVHEAGPRRTAPFVAVNCSAIPDTMFEAELFGYERGAFTDARQAKAGLFQTAHGGTIFLDEIGLLPVSLQGKLLAALEDRAVRRLGSTRTEPVDVAVVAATSVDLKRAIGEGQFREDLYHRIAVVSFELPPLRARGPDILLLADHFLARACADYGLARAALDPGRTQPAAGLPLAGQRARAGQRDGACGTDVGRRRNHGGDAEPGRPGPRATPARRTRLPCQVRWTMPCAPASKRPCEPLAATFDRLRRPRHLAQYLARAHGQVRPPTTPRRRRRRRRSPCTTPKARSLPTGNVAISPSCAPGFFHRRPSMSLAC